MTARPTAPLSPSTPAGQSLAAMPCYTSSCGRVTLYHGRWQDILPLPVDAIITDQPYGTGWLRGGGKVGKVGKFKPIVSSRPLRGLWEKEAYNGDNPLHPCQKPLPLMGWLVHELTMEGETVCDPFMGSGSTGIACIRAHRRFVGIEQDPAHYATALERIQNELSQGDMFLGCNHPDEH